MPTSSRGVRYSSDLVVIDLEACSPDATVNAIQRSNIIEIGAVKLDRRTLAVKSTFTELVRPRDYALEPFITELTGITPAMVSSRDTFERVCERFIAWHGPRNQAALAAFGVYYDLPLLRKECEAFGIDFRSHFVGAAMDVRTLAMAWLATHGHDTTGITIERTLRKMGIGDLGLSLHRALDDALAAAAITQFVHLERVDLGGAHGTGAR